MPSWKHFRKSFLRERTSRAKGPLDLIHTDACGSINSSSYGKNGYFLLFIDDFSRKTWVCFLIDKAEVVGALKKFKALVEKQSGYMIKVVSLDREGRFTSKNIVRKWDSLSTKGSEIATTRRSFRKKEQNYSQDGP